MGFVLYREKPAAGCAHSKKGDFYMHFTFLYNGAAQREGDYSTLEEAIRSIEVGQVDRTLWSIQYRPRGRNSSLSLLSEQRAR